MNPKVAVLSTSNALCVDTDGTPIRNGGTVKTPLAAPKRQSLLIFMQLRLNALLMPLWMSWWWVATA
jgi:hypothetical protein